MTSNGLASAYALGCSDHETEQLQQRAVLWNPSTRRMFEDAGIAAGMKVLDVGSGAGDVALLAAEIVGPEGSVLGIDVNPVILETARVRAKAAGFTHLTFRSGDIRQLDPSHEFDAVVGRLVLQYVKDPVAVLTAANQHLHPRGIAAFQEADLTVPMQAVPPSALLDRVAGWVREAFRRSGTDIELGIKLRQVFLKAGFREPRLHADRFMGGGPTWVGYAHLAGLTKSLLPFIEAGGIATAAEVQADTLAERLRDEILSTDSVVLYTALVTAWAQKP
jgi:ubiquinone/menaquinone biosynthesis C-methylase UbiE